MPAISLSVIMPAYNGGKFILEAIESAVRQFEPGDELVVQDGGSKDGSVEAIAARYKYDARVSVVSSPDSGQSEALERALLRVKNEYVGWLNADDIYFEGALAEVRRAFVRDWNLDLVYGNSVLFTVGLQGRRPVREHVPTALTRRSLLAHGCHLFSGSTFIRRNLLLAVGAFDKTLHYCMDYDLFFRLAAAEPFYAQLPVSVGGFRWHGEAKSSSMPFSFVTEARLVQARYATSRAERMVGELFLARYCATVLTTSVRHSRLYSGLRGARRF